MNRYKKSIETKKSIKSKKSKNKEIINEFISFKNIKLPKFKNFYYIFNDSIGEYIAKKTLNSWSKYCERLGLDPNNVEAIHFYDWVTKVQKVKNTFVNQLKIVHNGANLYFKRFMKDFSDLKLSSQQISDLLNQLIIFEKKYILSNRQYDPSEQVRNLRKYQDIHSIEGIDELEQNTRSHDLNKQTKKDSSWNEENSETNDDNIMKTNDYFRNLDMKIDKKLISLKNMIYKQAKNKNYNNQQIYEILNNFLNKLLNNNNLIDMVLKYSKSGTKIG